MAKKIGFGLLGLLIVVVIVGLIVLWQVDAIAKTAIERGGSYALGVDTTVSKVDIGLFTGKASVDGLTVTNPQGFKSQNLMKSGHFAVEVDTGTITSDTVVIPSVLLDGLEVYLERKEGKYNVQVITDHLKTIGGDDQADPEEPTEPQEPGRRYKVDRVEVRNVTGRAELPTGGSVPIKVNRIVLTNVSSDEGVSMGQLIGQLFPAIMGSVVAGVGELPGQVANMLTNDLSGAAEALGGQATALLGEGTQFVGENVGKIAEGAGEAAGKALEGAGDVGKGAGDAAGKAGEAAGKAVEDIGDGLKGLFGGNKQEQPE